MNNIKTLSPRVLSVLGFSFLFAYLMAFLFEGRVLYGLLDFYKAEARGYVFGAVVPWRRGDISSKPLPQRTNASKPVPTPLFARTS